MKDDQTKEVDLDEVLATDCPDCGRRGRGLSTCVHCGSFIAMTLALSPDDESEE